MTREEAIKIVKEFISGTCLHLTDQEAFETLIPELTESEDERIRQEIISALMFANDGGVYDKHIAYLEKQKDASKAIEAVDRIDKYIDENVANAHDMKDSNPDKKYYRGWDDALGKMAGILQDVYSGEKQKEQMPVVTHGETYHVDTLGTQQFIAGKMPQKSAEWSKNDTVFLNEITDFFENKTVRLQHDIDMYAHWLKSLPERLVLQPKAEWSEEDDMMKDNIISVLSAFVSTVECESNPSLSSSYPTYRREIDWLKSLPMRCPKSSDNWKPSEEQMSMLLAVIRDPNNAGSESCSLALKSIYEQLKKLM